MKEAEVRRRLLGKIDSQTLYTMLYYMDKWYTKIVFLAHLSRINSEVSFFDQNCCWH
jgi:hypothetical protein